MSENTKEKSIKTFQLKFKKRIESAIFFIQSMEFVKLLKKI